jgi:hypothetical protein
MLISSMEKHGNNCEIQKGILTELQPLPRAPSYAFQAGDLACPRAISKQYGEEDMVRNL